jgi:drug/metabolite transporter (DMT)-like permease
MRRGPARPYLRCMVATAQTARLESQVAFGLALTLASAFLFSWLGVLTQLAYAEGASIGTVMVGRFLIAAAILWPVVWIARARWPGRRDAARGLLLGVGYSGHVWLFSESLARLDAGLVDLLLFTYPALVVLGAVALRRERLSIRRAVALGTTAAGTSLVLVGGLDGVDPLGAALALGSAVAYSLYILTSAGELERTDPIVLIALVTTGAAGALTIGGVARSDVSLEVGASAGALIALLGLVVVTAMYSFIGGIGRLGPSRASIVSAVQPALTPVVGLLVFGDVLGPAQVLGGALVIAAVVVLEGRRSVLGARSWLSWLPRRERRLVRRLRALDIPSGRRVTHQGGVGGAFFVIERGRATITRDGREIADLGPGGFFGEIALLQDGLRTASVVAATDLRVRVMPRREFARARRTFPTLVRLVQDAAQERLLRLSAAVATP